jgi:hypothetical protein
MSLWWIDATGVRGMESPWTIFFFIVMWLMSFGWHFSVVLGYA